MSECCSLSFVTASEQRPLQCEEDAQLDASLGSTAAASTSGVMFRLHSVDPDDPLQLPTTSFHHIGCLPVFTLHCTTPTGSLERIEGYAALSDEMKRGLHSELTEKLQRAVGVMRDVQADEFNRCAESYVHQQHIQQLQCKACSRMLLDAVELPCCPAFPLCALCWQHVHLERSVLVELGGCDDCGKSSSLVSLVGCPSCKRSVEVAKVVEDTAMRTRVGGKLVRCANEEHGCEAVVTASEALVHFRRCPHEPRDDSAAHEARTETGSDEKQTELDGDEDEEYKQDADWENGSAVSDTDSEEQSGADARWDRSRSWIASDSDSEAEHVHSPVSATPLTGPDLAAVDVETGSSSSAFSAAVDELVETSRIVSFASPLVTMEAAAPTEEIAAEGEVVDEEPDVLMAKQLADIKQAEDSDEPGSAADATIHIAPAVADTDSRDQQGKPESADALPASLARAGNREVASAPADLATPLVSVDAYGHTMSISLLGLRHSRSQQSEQRVPLHAETSLVEGAMKRRADTSETAEPEDRKRVKTDMTVD